MRIEKIEKSEDLKRSKIVRERERENLMRSICGDRIGRVKKRKLIYKREREMWKREAT